MLEFVAGSVLLLLPLIYLLIAVFAVQRASYAAATAAREAGRAFATAPTGDIGLARARYAAALAFGDQGISAAPSVTFTAAGSGCGGPGVTPSLLPGAAYTVCVAQEVHPPVFDRGPLAGRLPALVRVVGRFTLSVDTYRETG